MRPSSWQLSLLALMFSSIAIIFLALIPIEISTNQTVANFQQPTSATAKVDYKNQICHPYFNQNNACNYYIGYIYQANHQQYRNKESVSYAVYNNISPGSQQPIVYSNTDKQKSYLTASEPTNFPVASIIITSIIFLLLVLLAVWAQRRTNRHRRSIAA